MRLATDLVMRVCATGSMKVDSTWNSPSSG
jgi:hypothetical protein